MAIHQVLLKGGGAGGDLDQITANAPDVLSGRKVVDRDGNVVVGTMPDNNTLTSNGTVPGISVGFPQIPVRTGHNPMISTCTDGVKRFCMSPTKGYYQDPGGSYIAMPAVNLGSAANYQVIAGARFTSEWGVYMEGTMPNKGSGVIARNSSRDDNVARFYVGLPGNGYYSLDNDTPVVVVPYDQLRNTLGITSDKIKSGANIAGVWGSVADGNSGRVAFNGATFDGVLLSGVASSGRSGTKFASNGTIYEIYFKHKDGNTTFAFPEQNSSIRNYRYAGDVGVGGLTMVVRTQNGGSSVAGGIAYVFCGPTFSKSINMTPFRTLRIGYKIKYVQCQMVTTPAYSGRTSCIKVAAAIIDIFGHDAEERGRFNAFRPHNINSESRFTLHTIPFTGLNSINGGEAQRYMDVNLEGVYGQYYLSIGAACETLGTGTADVTINHIEFIN